MIRGVALGFMLIAAATPQCNGASSSSGSTSAQNFQTIVVNSGPTGQYFNGAFTTVTICVPGQSSCQTITGVLVDTGSSGLRVLSSALSLSLPQQTDPSGSPVAECLQFVDGFVWGPVRTADVKLGGEQASNVPVQIVGAPGFSAIPTACSSTGTPENTLDTLGANAILGVGLFREDCGSGCTVSGSSNPGLYYSCPAAGCTGTAQPLAKQVQNPVWLFSSDNNGVAIQLPQVATGGQATASGMMVFGIGTQTDNALGAAKVLTTDGNGDITTVFNGQSYPKSYIDSGSNGTFFLDTKTTGIPLCKSSTDFYCPLTPLSLSATHRGANGTTGAVSFTAGNVDALNGNFAAFSEVTGPSPGNFDWGLSFFFGRTVFTAIEGQTTPGGTGPYFAY
jgi:hypothetical protein